MSDVQKAFLEAYMEVRNPILDSVNPHFRSKFASLKETLSVINDACRPHGIVYRQTLRKADGRYQFESSVMSGEEEFRLSEFPVGTDDNPQKRGIDYTYTKRQQAQADWGIVGEEDTDGEGAEQPEQPDPQIKEHWANVSKLKAEAEAVGIKAEGMQGWASASITNPDGSPKPMNRYELRDVIAFEQHISHLIADKKRLGQ